MIFVTVPGFLVFGFFVMVPPKGEGSGGSRGLPLLGCGF